MLVAEDVGGVAIGEGEQHKSWPVFGAHRGYAPTAVCHSDRCHDGVQQCWYLSRWLIAFWYSIVKAHTATPVQTKPATTWLPSPQAKPPHQMGGGSAFYVCVSAIPIASHLPDDIVSQRTPATTATHTSDTPAVVRDSFNHSPVISFPPWTATSEGAGLGQVDRAAHERVHKRCIQKTGHPRSPRHEDVQAGKAGRDAGVQTVVDVQGVWISTRAWSFKPALPKLSLGLSPAQVADTESPLSAGNAGNGAQVHAQVLHAT